MSDKRKPPILSSERHSKRAKAAREGAAHTARVNKQAEEETAVLYAAIRKQAAAGDTAVLRRDTRTNQQLIFCIYVCARLSLAYVYASHVSHPIHWIRRIGCGFTMRTRGRAHIKHKYVACADS